MLVKLLIHGHVEKLHIYIFNARKAILVVTEVRWHLFSVDNHNGSILPRLMFGVLYYNEFSEIIYTKYETCRLSRMNKLTL